MKLVRTYLVCVALLFCGYVWCAWTGYRVLGDDNESGSSSRVRMGRGAHYFYHK